MDHTRIVFPPEICATSDRPDIIIWSRDAKHVILIELTCPAEENIQSAAIRKQSRYIPLQQLIHDTTNEQWSSTCLTIEAGARGFVAQSFKKCFRQLGLSALRTKAVVKAVSQCVSRCSYAIFLSRNSPQWKQQALVAVDI